MIQQTQSGLKARSVNPRDQPVFLSIEDWFSTLEFLCADPTSHFYLGAKGKVRQAMPGGLTLSTPNRKMTLWNQKPFPVWVVRSLQASMAEELEIDQKKFAGIPGNKPTWDLSSKQIPINRNSREQNDNDIDGLPVHV